MEFGIHNWVGLKDGKGRRQLCALRLYDEKCDAFDGCDFNGGWDENETVIFNLAPTENIVSIRQDLSPSLNPVNFQFLTFDFSKYMSLAKPVPKTPGTMSLRRRGSHAGFEIIPTKRMVF